MPVPAVRQPALGPVLLALDTATERMHAALSVGPDALGRTRTTTLDLPGGAQASATLLPALTGLLADAGLAWSNLDALAFGAGPGAFTGLRTACATVQGLALGLAVPVLPLDTLMAVAEDARLAGSVSPSSPLWTLQDARMGELYAAAYLWDASALQWQVHAAPQLWPLAHALAMLHLDGPAAPARPWAGNAVQADAALLAPLLATRCNGELAGEPAAPRGAALASLARAAWARGEAVDAALALPRYVRDKVAQTTAERQQHAGAPRP